MANGMMASSISAIARSTCSAVGGVCQHIADELGHADRKLDAARRVVDKSQPADGIVNLQFGIHHVATALCEQRLQRADLPAMLRRKGVRVVDP